MQYTATPAVLPVIKHYAEFIYDAYQVALSYDKASVLFAQYNATNMAEPIKLQQVWQELNNITFHSKKVDIHAHAIKASAKAHNVTI